MGSSAIDTGMIGRVLADTYKIERLIGEGGMGAVYEASHTRVPRKFAIKLLLTDDLSSPEVFQRFRREAEIASSIGHDNITQVFDFNHTADGVPFMVLEYLEGEDLDQRLRRVGSLSVEETSVVLAQVASGLTAAHQCGVVHRDLKPANLFLSRRGDGSERLKILDFGVSKITNSASMATRTGSILGTPNFMSPEQADGQVGAIDARTDVFALGCILFQCLTGRMAFEGPTLMGTLYQIVHGKPARFLEDHPAVPEPIKSVVMAALNNDIGKRTQSVGELWENFLDASRRCVAAIPMTVMGTPPPPLVDTLSPVPVSALPSLSQDVVRTPMSSQGQTAQLQDRVLPPKTRSRYKSYIALGIGLSVVAVIAFVLPNSTGDSKEVDSKATQGAGSVDENTASQPAKTGAINPHVDAGAAHHRGALSDSKSPIAKPITAVAKKKLPVGDKPEKHQAVEKHQTVGKRKSRGKRKGVSQRKGKSHGKRKGVSKLKNRRSIDDLYRKR